MNFLISPLNWGIGHATRLVPIIKHLQKKHKIILAADGKSKVFLEQEFPHHKVLSAPKLDISYTKNASLLPLKMLSLLPKLFFFYFNNKRFVRKTISTNKIDTIISDNRFGFFSAEIKSIFITHQLNIKAKNKLTEKIILKINKLNVEKFDECWIPDTKLSGELSNNDEYKILSKNIGFLSRFPVEIQTKNAKKYSVVVIISGPEPQRTIFQEKIISILQNSEHKTLIISGKLNDVKSKVQENITIINHANTVDFQEFILNSDIIISRAGYSSIMDLVSLKQTALLIPTPGQTEQEYLANYLHKEKIFYTVNQKILNKNTIFAFYKNKHIFETNLLKFNNNIKLNNFLDEQFSE